MRDAPALGNEFPDRLSTVFVAGSSGRCYRQHLARRSVRAEVSSGVVADKGPFFIHAERWTVKRRVAWVGTNCRLAKNCEYKTSYVNPSYTYLVYGVLIKQAGLNNQAKRNRLCRCGQRKCA